MFATNVGLENYRGYFTFVVFIETAASGAISTSAITPHFTAADLCIHSNEPYLSSIRRDLGTGGPSVHAVLVLLFFKSILVTAGLTGFFIFLTSNCNTTIKTFFPSL